MERVGFERLSRYLRAYLRLMPDTNGPVAWLVDLWAKEFGQLVTTVDRAIAVLGIHSD
jgi:hypothetical protein